MANVMIKCPATQEPVPIGVNVDYASYSQITMTNCRLERCPACGGSHTFSTEDTFPDA